jgi:hypothetical protein
LYHAVGVSCRWADEAAIQQAEEREQKEENWEQELMPFAIPSPERNIAGGRCIYCEDAVTNID